MQMHIEWINNPINMQMHIEWISMTIMAIINTSKPIGLDSSPRRLWKWLAGKLEKMGWHESSHESGIWFKKSGEDFMILACFVDDLLLGAPTYEKGEQFFQELKEAFSVDLDYERDPKKYIGFNIYYNEVEEGSISIDSASYTKSLVDKYNADGKLPKRMMPSDPAVTFRHLEEEMKNNGSDDKNQIRRAKRIVRELLYQSGK